MADIYRADHVGSLLRPESLKEARNMFYAGGMSADTLRESEDAAILEALAQQERIGVAVFTDGEFRRSGFQNDYRMRWKALSTPKHRRWSVSGKGRAANLRRKARSRWWAQGSASSIALLGARPNI